MADSLPDVPGIEAVHGTFHCGTCGWEEDGWMGEHPDCPNCTDPGGFPEPLMFEADPPEDWDDD